MTTSAIETSTPVVTYDVELAYKEIMADNGQTYLGEFARKYNKHKPTLFMEISIYAQRNELPSPATVVQMEPARKRRNSPEIERTATNKGFTISVSKLSGTVLENALKAEMVVTDEGILIRPVEISTTQETVSSVSEALEQVSSVD